MTPRFADAVDPIFECALNALDRIERKENLPAVELQTRVCRWLDDSEAKLGANPEWGLAKYALVCWIDEILNHTDWEGRDWWNNNILEFSLFRTANAATLFYQRSKEASAMGPRDALEVYYLCVILGFRGIYSDLTSEPADAAHFDLPANLEGWIGQTAANLRERPRPSLSPGRKAPAAPPLEGQSAMLASFLAASVLGAIAAVATWASFFKS